MKLPHSITIYNKYLKGRDTAYKSMFIENCMFSPKDAVKLGNVQVQGSNNGKILIYEEDVDMTLYKKPNDFNGEGFTFSTESIVVIGEGPEITSIRDLEKYEHYTVTSVLHQNYSLVLPYHFSLEVK